MDNWPFRESIVSLRWLSALTRPDISNAMRAVARDQVLLSAESHPLEGSPWYINVRSEYYTSSIGIASTALPKYRSRQGLCQVFRLRLWRKLIAPLEGN